MNKDSHTARVFTHRFLRRIGISVLAAILSFVLADRANATCLHFGSTRVLTYAERYTAGDYLDRGWYYLLDDGQYYYLDKGQYNLLGGLSYRLGHPCYPKLYERESEQAVGFTNRVNTDWFSLHGGQVPISEYAVLSYHFNAGDYIDSGQYYYLDNGRYYYLDRGQYNLLGGLGYTLGRPYYQARYDWGYYPSVSISATPEPSTILYLVLGVFGILALKRK
jgi:hypothetical protein